MDLGKLNTNIGHKIISAAVFNDIASLLVLGIILDIRSNLNSISEMTYSIGIAIFKIALLTFILAVAYKLFQLARQNVVFVKKQFDLFIGFLYGKESLFAIVILFVLIFAGLFAALFLSKDILGFRNFIKVRNNTNVITMGFLAPIFFAGIGVQFNFSAINNFMLLLIVLLASVASKMIGGYFGGRLSGLGKYESVTLGVGLNSRGIIELVIANIALSNGFIDKSLFSILVIMGLFTTLISPYLLKKSFSLIDKNN
jgi:Kef-type K+ transport system membrane component KefB